MFRPGRAPLHLAGERVLCLVGVIFWYFLGPFLTFFRLRGANGAKTSPRCQKEAKKVPKLRIHGPFRVIFEIFEICSLSFFLSFCVSPRGVPFSTCGALSGSFWRPLAHFLGTFWGSVGFVEIDLPLKQTHTFFQVFECHFQHFCVSFFRSCV